MKSILFFFVLLGLQCNAQRMKWHEGAIVLSDGKVISGNISVQPEHDLILFRTTGNPIVYPPHKLQRLYYYDNDANINRRYISLRSSETVKFSDQLYEVVLQGRVSVIRRQRSSYNTNDAGDFNYFCRFNGNVLPLHKFSSKVYPLLLSPKDRRLCNYIKENHLDPAMAANVIRIIEYYNQLMVTDEALARY